MIGTNVEVYWNLHKKCWSVRDRKTRLVVGHVNHLVLRGVTFHVSAAGNARVRREGRKNVHAFARGNVASLDNCNPFRAAVPITYNPYEHTTFVEKSTERPVDHAHVAWMNGRKVSALLDMDSRV